MEHIKDLIESKISEGTIIIKELDTMRQRSGPAFNVTYYVNDDVEAFRKRINKWQLTTKEILIRSFGEEHRYTLTFGNSITAKNKGFNYKKEFISEINQGLAVLESISETLGLGFDDTSCQIVNSSNQKVKLFISHSSSDSAIIKKFVEDVLQLGLGLNPEDIAFTSEESFGVEPGENIAKYIRENIIGASVVLVMISKNYKASEVCLNEMGAAWALGKKCISVVLPGADFKDLGWLTSLDKAVSLTDKKQLANLCKTLSKYLPVNLNERFTPVISKIDEFITAMGTIKQPTQVEKNEIIDNPVKAVYGQSGALKLFDAVFKSVNLNLGEYIIQLNVRLRPEIEHVSIRHVYLRNQTPFFGTTDNPKNEMEFKSYMTLGDFEIDSDVDKSYRFVKEDYNKLNHAILDMVIEKDHTISMSFIQYLKTIKECDGSDDLQLKGWCFVVQYNVNDEVSIPLTLKPVDINAQGKYWHN